VRADPSVIIRSRAAGFEPGDAAQKPPR